MIITTDTIGSAYKLSKAAYDQARKQGFTLPFENILFAASHTHSGIFHW